MKTFLITIITFLTFALTCSAQWTPATGIITTTNNVGIGTSTPASKLDVQGLINVGAPMNISAFTPATIHTGGSGSTTNMPYIIMENSTAYAARTPLSDFHIISDGTNVPEIGWTTGNRPGNMLLRSYGTSGGGNINLQAKGVLNFLTNDVQSMLIDNSGNVAIGTTNPQGYKLAVNGTVIAVSMTVKLYANWPDYVFKPTYQLPSLADVKNYIDKNHHLQNVPSAAEVEKNGINLGEMNKVLVQKVEELTLYLIEKDKQLQEQQKTNQAFKQQLDYLTEELKALKPAKGDNK